MTNPRRSRAITEGDERAPNRSMLRAVGFADPDFQKPIVGVASAHSNLTPCNVGIGPLADRAMDALRAAGTMRGSALITPSTSVQISISAAPSAAPKIAAE